MAREIFANGSVTRLAQPLAVGEMTLTVVSSAAFPVPVVGEEFFMLTVAGACSDTIEIMRAVEICGPNCIRVEARGLEGTEERAFLPGDLAYHSLTANGAQEIMDRFQWYLGPFATAPTTDNNGLPLQDGMQYFNTTSNTMFVYSDGQWISTSKPAESYLTRQVYFAELGPFPAGVPLPAADVYGNTLPVPLDETEHLVRVEFNGIHLIEEINVGILAGDFTVNYATSEVTPKAEIPTGATMVVTLHYKVDTDPFMHWLGDWEQQTYYPQQVVRDGDWTMVALVETTDRAAPTLDGAPEYSVEPTPVWVEKSDVSLIKAGQTYTFLEDGWIENIRVWVPNITDHSFRVILEDVTNATTREIALGPDLIADQWNVVTQGSSYVQPGNVFKITLEISHDTGGAAEYVDFATFWASNPPDFATTQGHLSFDAVPEASQENSAFGIDLQFQAALISPDWDVVASTGNSAAGGAGSIGLHSDLTGRDTEDSHPQTAITNLLDDQEVQDDRLTAVEAEVVAPSDGAIYGRQGTNWVKHNELTVVSAPQELVAAKHYYDDGNGITYTLPEIATLVEPIGIRISKGDGGGVTTINAHVNDGGAANQTMLFFRGDDLGLLLIGGVWVPNNESVFGHTDVFLSALQVPPASVLTLVAFDGVRKDTMNAFSASHITVPVEGLYKIIVHAFLSVNSLTDNLSYIRINDGAGGQRLVEQYDDPPSGANDATHGGVFELELLAGDTISFWVIIHTGSPGIEEIRGDADGTLTTMTMSLVKQYDIT